MTNCLIVNLLGGPGISKSTMAAHVFAELKWKGINCELVNEYAKEKVWEQSLHVLKNQRLIYGKQYHMVLRAAENVDVVITDSPLILSAIYAKQNETKFIDMIVDDFKAFRNLNFLLIRKKAYCQSGRVHNEDEAKQIDSNLKSMLDKFQIEYTLVEGRRDCVADVVDLVMLRK